jgi:signal transduction histidine kinase
MASPELVEQLAAHRTLGAAPREELAWLASHGSLRHMDSGDVLTAKGTRPEGMFVVLEGCIAIFIDRGAGRNKVMEWREGDVTGLLPYSRLVSPPGDSVAQEPTTVLVVPAGHLRAMIHECYGITGILVHTMIDRVRVFTSSGLHDEKMISLGKLSAGLAHELNNPASAIERSAAVLTDRLEDAERAARSLGASRLTASQLAAADEVRASCIAAPVHGVRSPLEQAEREEAIADWLDDHGLDAGIAELLADTPVTLEGLNRLAGEVDGPVLNAVLHSAAAGCAVRSLALEIQDAAMRISGLVMAIKGFTHMDQATVAESVELVDGLRNTIVVLRSKARSKAIGVVLDVEPDLPRVRGFIGELNQIWANLIDNALDAAPEAGHVEVAARRFRDRVVVSVVDNGAGVPADIRDRIFEPFFTTKGVGQGTGLGLDIVRRLVLHNDGEISVESEPGRTEFRVVLPLAAAVAVGAGR